MSIKPAFPAIHLIIAISFIALSILFFASPYADWKMMSAAVFFTSLGSSFFWLIDYSFLRIDRIKDAYLFKGFFLIRRIDISFKEIKGYEILQKVDQLNGLHEEIQLVTKKNKRIILPKIAYSNYEEVMSMVASDLQLLEKKELKYAKTLGKLIPAMLLISGILAGLVGIIKILRW